MDGYYRHFLNALCKPPTTYFVCEARRLDVALLSLENRFARKIFVFHSVHIRPGTEIIRDGNRALLGNLKQADALVVLTPQQRQDISDRFGYADRLRVIPHAAAAAVPSAWERRIPGRVVMVARLSKEKRIEAAIRAFAQVRARLLGASLEIWGSGPMQKSLEALVDELSLSQAVRFAGYSQDARKAFQSAECSILTSHWEGYPLTVMESLAAGTPCIAYDIKYGPASMITDGQNGFLVKDGDEQALANKIAEFLCLPVSRRQEMAEAAAASMASFSEQHLVERWVELLNSLKRQVAQRPPVVKRVWRRLPKGLRDLINSARDRLR
jgi:poly(glycerol-phosphate) alpha-glucosyltransferase